MRAVFVSCTVRAYELASETEKKWKNVHPDVEITHIVKCSALPSLSVKETLSEAVGRNFEAAELIVFFTALGIAVRSISPFIKHKAADPAVVAVDECGRYSISVLSGHHGGANHYAGEIAYLIGAEPVITTATDMEGKFAVDEFARINGLEITDWELAKKISAKLLAGEEVALFAEEEGIIAVSRNGKLSEYTEKNRRQSMPAAVSCGLVISNREKPDKLCGFENVLQLVPVNIYLGIGCRRGVDSTRITAAVREALRRANISRRAVAKAGSIDLKAKEAGLLGFCEQYGIELVTFSADELLMTDGSVSSSPFVKEITGVDNVCERSALAVCGGRLILPRQVFDGVTVAIAEKTFCINFNI